MSKDSKLDSNGTSEVFPKVQKVHLRMGTETVVKDMPLISDDAWTYNDLLVSMYGYGAFLRYHLGSTSHLISIHCSSKLNLGLLKPCNPFSI